MKRLGLLVGVGAVAVVAVAAWVFFSGGSGEPSTEVTAAPVTAVATTTPSSTTAPATEGSGTAAPTTAAASTAAATTTTVTGAGAVTFEIDKAASVATFTLNEELRGAPTTVVGTTSELAGQILVDFGTPANSQLGEIVINARTLTTGNGFRDRAIRGQILDSAEDEFEFITFTPTSIEGLPSEATAPFDFEVTGDLTIRTITQPVTFTVSITAVSESSLEGTATAQVLRSDFDLNIPSVPSVANVTDEVALELMFTASPTG